MSRSADIDSVWAPTCLSVLGRGWGQAEPAREAGEERNAGQAVLPRRRKLFTQGLAPVHLLRLITQQEEDRVRLRGRACVRRHLQQQRW